RVDGGLADGAGRLGRVLADLARPDHGALDEPDRRAGRRGRIASAGEYAAHEGPRSLGGGVQGRLAVEPAAAEGPEEEPPADGAEVGADLRGAAHGRV